MRGSMNCIRRMKWNSTSGLMGTSLNLTLLDCAPMYSRKSLEFWTAACNDLGEMHRAWIMKKVIKSLGSSIVVMENRLSV